MIHLFVIFIFYYLSYIIKCSWCIIFCLLYIIICSFLFNFLFAENNYLFVFLKYLFPVSEIMYLSLKSAFKKLSYKYRQVWSCFEDLVIRKIMVQFKINLDARLKSYSFFSIPVLHACGWCQHFVYFCMYGQIVSGKHKQ